MIRFGWVIATCLSGSAATAAAFVNPQPKLIWNASASAPIGLYAVRPMGALHDSELVAVMPPEPVASLLADGGYLPRGVPLMKRVLALPGQTVCRDGVLITVDQVEVGAAQARDRRGGDLPVWQGCRTLHLGEVFLMNPGVPDSLDGRYFGPLPASSIIGRAAALWTDEEGDGHFVWRAAAR
ncbi:S26 family signal peptidase [Methylocapsa polymorpha]|uniref:S26 family signal peptidase n=1 Tax=Methylocapsa polymorpha TaxID=3080828 RepID=A0ABZ0HQZ4_9HYPH|nr:S26 family signal peptidase [Methylocapsa sp. RX1]